MSELSEITDFLVIYFLSLNFQHSLYEILKDVPHNQLGLMISIENMLSISNIYLASFRQ